MVTPLGNVFSLSGFLDLSTFTHFTLTLIESLRHLFILRKHMFEFGWVSCVVFWPKLPQHISLFWDKVPQHTLHNCLQALDCTFSCAAPTLITLQNSLFFVLLTLIPLYLYYNEPSPMLHLCCSALVSLMHMCWSNMMQNFVFLSLSL